MAKIKYQVLTMMWNNQNSPCTTDIIIWYSHTGKLKNLNKDIYNPRFQQLKNIIHSPKNMTKIFRGSKFIIAPNWK